jgi:hypothetical protein
MKQQLHEQTKMNCQARQVIVDVHSENYQIHTKMLSNSMLLNIFQVRNKGKGPPGRMRSPELSYCLTRDNKLAVFRIPHPEPVEGNKTPVENKLITHINQNFITIKFLIMKKQILFLAFVVLAGFAGITSAYGQAVLGSAPRPLAGCTDDPLHPIPGKSYTYTVGGTGTNFTWWATKDPNFIQMSGSPAVPVTNMATTKLTVSAGQLESTSANYAVTPAAATPTVDIKWSSQILAGTKLDGVAPGKTPTFVVVQAEDATNCTNNLKVYQLDPKVAFTVDILPMKLDGTTTGDYAADIKACFAPVASATYSAGGVHYNYGTNILYYEVVAANFFTSYDGSFKINGLQTGQSAVVEWSYTTGASATWTALGAAISGDGTGTAQTVGTQKILVDATTNTSSGVSIYLKVTISNGVYEGIVDAPISMLVNAVDVDGNEDIDNATCAVPAAGSNFEDVATETLTQRPTVNSATPLNPGPGNGVFVPAN